MKSDSANEINQPGGDQIVKLNGDAGGKRFDGIGIVNGGGGELAGGGSFVALKSPGNDYSVIIETKNAKAPRQIQFTITAGLSADARQSGLLSEKSKLEAPRKSAQKNMVCRISTIR